MKQYKDVPTCYPCGRNAGIPTRGQVKTEALLVGAYDRLTRANRRAINHSAEAWWREQVKSERVAGMPWLYHCCG